jgi:hypothetical protein
VAAPPRRHGTATELPEFGSLAGVQRRAGRSTPLDDCSNFRTFVAVPPMWRAEQRSTDSASDGSPLLSEKLIETLAVAKKWMTDRASAIRVRVWLRHARTRLRAERVLDGSTSEACKALTAVVVVNVRADDYGVLRDGGGARRRSVGRRCGYLPARGALLGGGAPARDVIGVTGRFWRVLHHASRDSRPYPLLQFQFPWRKHLN